MPSPPDVRPFVALLLLAGLQQIDPELYEAARSDGASAWQQLRHVTLPLLRPALLVALVFRTLDAFRVFDLIYVLTGGGPGSATRFVGVHIFKEVFPKTNYGYGSTISVIVLYLTIVACWLLYVTMLAPRTKKD